MEGRIRTVDRLALTRAEELDLAHRHLDDLATAAAALVAAGHDPDTASCGDADCLLAADPVGADVCTLARRLANLVPAPARLRPAGDLAAAIDGFRSALTGALDAVRACRQTAHANGTCWFTPTPGADGCAEVLRLAHRLG